MASATTASVHAQPPRQAGIRLRIKILGGDLSAEQWRAIARIAAEFTPATPLHLTTRQDIELHDLPADQVQAVQGRLAEVGLTGRPSCGDSVRNITVCPCSGVRTGSADLGPLAWQIRRTLEAIEGDLALPRKFKISLSACQACCGQPWINDLGLAAVRRDGQWSFRVMVAGSLGVQPALAMELDEPRAPGDVLALAVAALRVFAAHGDRQNRKTARLRHVRQRMGDEAFASTLGRAFEQARDERDWPTVEVPEVAAGFDESAPLTFADGNASSAAVEPLADLADRADLRVRIDTHHRVIVSARDRGVLDRALADLPAALAPAARPQPSIVACPGRQWCKNAVTDTGEMAQLIRAELADRLAPGTIVSICGCQNNCAHSAVAPIGLVGGKAGGGDVYSLFLGGGLGRDTTLARRVAVRLSPRSVIDHLARIGPPIT